MFDESMYAFAVRILHVRPFLAGGFDHESDTSTPKLHTFGHSSAFLIQTLQKKKMNQSPAGPLLGDVILHPSELQIPLPCGL